MPRMAALVFAAFLGGCAAPQPSAPTAPPQSPVVGGNDARLLIDGPDVYRAMFAAMEGARSSINLETYILGEGEIADRVAAVLEAKARSGVRVRLMYDAVGSLGTPKSYFERLRAGGVAVCQFNPVERVDHLNNRNHRKILIVDGRVAFTGGVNLSQTYASSSKVARAKPGQETKEGWRDTQVEVAGPVVAQFQRLYADMWTGQPQCGPIDAVDFRPRQAQGDKRIRLVKSEPGRGSEVYTELLHTVAGAKTRVWITMGYFVPDELLRRALEDAARRGVDVQLVLPGFSDFWAPLDAGRSYYAELLDAGVKIHEWDDALMHAKTAVIDSRWSSVGSTNLDWRSLVHNYEADIIVDDGAFARQMERRFRLDVQAARPIERNAWARRGAKQKLKEWVAHQWEYLL